MRMYLMPVVFSVNHLSVCNVMLLQFAPTCIESLHFQSLFFKVPHNRHRFFLYKLVWKRSQSFIECIISCTYLIFVNIQLTTSIYDCDLISFHRLLPVYRELSTLCIWRFYCVYFQLFHKIIKILYVTRCMNFFFLLNSLTTVFENLRYLI